MTHANIHGLRPRAQRSLTAMLAVATLVGCRPDDGQDDLTEGATSTTGDGAMTDGSTASAADPTGEPEPTGEPGTTGESEPVAWGDCPPALGDACATLEVPLDWSQPDGPTTPVLATRRLAGAQPGKAQLWLLAGGPGQSGEGLVPVFDLLQGALPGFDLYALEHRGVGESSRLGCPAQEALDSAKGSTITADEWVACAAHLADAEATRLPHLTVSNAARDLGAFIERTRAVDQQVYLYGGSYGTLLAMRYLQLFPDAVDGAVVDSVVAPGALFLSQYDQNYDVVLQALSGVCAADPTCSEKLGADPWAAIVAALDGYEAGACAQLGIPADGVRKVLAFLVQFGFWRRDVFPLMYRLARCEEADVAVVGAYVGGFLEAIESSGSQDAGRFSLVLQAHIGMSELWETPAPAPAELQARCDDAVVCPGFGPPVAEASAVWPRYTADALAGAWPTTDVPVLALQGTFDPQTPYTTAVLFEKHMTGTNHHFVAVPEAPHGIAFGVTSDDGQTLCGLEMMTSFLNTGGGPPDTACLATLDTIDFVFDPMSPYWLFSVDDPWEGAPSDAFAPLVAPDVLRTRVQVQLARRGPLAR